MDEEDVGRTGQAEGSATLMFTNAGKTPVGWIVLNSWFL